MPLLAFCLVKRGENSAKLAAYTLAYQAAIVACTSMGMKYKTLPGDLIFGAAEMITLAPYCDDYDMVI